MVGSETMVRNSRKIVWPLSTLFASVNTWWPRLGWKKFCTENAPIRMVCNERHSPRIGRTRARVIIGCAEKNPPRGWMTSKGWAGALCGVERSKSVSRRFETLFAPRFSSFSRPRERERKIGGNFRVGACTLCSARVIRADWNNSQVRTRPSMGVDRTACSTSIEKIIHLKGRSRSPFD